MQIGFQSKQQQQQKTQLNSNFAFTETSMDDSSDLVLLILSELSLSKVLELKLENFCSSKILSQSSKSNRIRLNGFYFKKNLIPSIYLELSESNY